MNNKYMTVKDLKDLLNKVPEDSVIVLSTDSEGNSYGIPSKDTNMSVGINFNFEETKKNLVIFPVYEYLEHIYDDESGEYLDEARTNDILVDLDKKEELLARYNLDEADFQVIMAFERRRRFGDINMFLVLGRLEKHVRDFIMNHYEEFLEVIE